MSTVRHPNRRRKAFAALTQALIAWHGRATQGEVIELRKTWPRWPCISSERVARTTGGLAHVG